MAGDPNGESNSEQLAVQANSFKSLAPSRIHFFTGSPPKNKTKKHPLSYICALFPVAEKHQLPDTVPGSGGDKFLW